MSSLILIARSELRARWASLLVIGLLAGLAGGAVVSAAALARRTATADERLAAATNADDVRTIVFGGTPEATMAIGQEALDLPEVEGGRIALGSVARVEAPGIVYLGVMAGPERWGDDVLSPVLVTGRLPRPDRADDIVVNEAVTGGGPIPINLGDTFTLHLLTAEEFASFDAGAPLEGLGGDQEVTVVGVVRLPGSPDDLPPFIGTPALAAAHPATMGVLGAAFVQLRPGADLGAYTDAVNQAGRSVRRPAPLAEFPTMSVISTATQSRASTETTTGVLTTGLLILAAVATLVGTGAVAQASLRHHAASADAQQVETAIGLTTAERTRARLLAALPAVALAATLTAGAGLASAGLTPPGALRAVEPHPGWAPNLALIAAVTAIGPLILIAAVMVSASRVTGRPSRRILREAPLVSRVAGLGGRPPTILGLRFALERSSGSSGVSARAAMATVAAGVAGLLAAMIFVASLDRVVHTPVRYGYPTDLVIADAGPDVVTELRRDDRFDTVVAGLAADLLIDGRSTTGTSQEALVGTLDWELAAGRAPATTEEIVLGTRLADELGKGVGDVVDLQDASGDHHKLAVVGVGVVPNHGGRGLGRSAGLTAEGLAVVAAAEPFGELGLSVRPGIDLDDVLRDLSEHYEVQPAELPLDVANLEQIDRVPVLLGLFLAVLCLATVAHAITMTARHRRADLAIARALGFTARQSASSVVVMALTTTLAGVLVALPLGLVLGTTIWRLVAEGAAVIGDASYRWWTLGAVVPISALLALVLAALPARRAGRQPTSIGLQAE